MTDCDVTEMLKIHKEGAEITVWCYGKSTRRSRSRSPVSRSSESTAESSTRTAKKPTASKPSCYESHLQKMSEVDDVYKKLDKQHKEKYSDEQLRAWAHLIQLDKHNSYEDPPDKPFFCGRVKTSTSAAGPSTPSGKTPPTSSGAGISPSRRVGLRTQCIDQLQKWHSLLESGAISREQYDELQQTILSDIKKL